MRLFIAAQLPDQVVQALSETSAALRDSVRGRYVRPDLFHVTLAFLGEVDPWRVDDVQAALARACAGHQQFDVRLGELGCFGKRAKATLWQGFCNPASFGALAEDVRAELAREGFDFDAKPFRAHVTLMRAADLTAGQLPMPTCAGGTVDSVCLFKSDLSGKHPVYEALSIERLEPRAS